MYRALGLKARATGVSTDDGDGLALLLGTTVVALEEGDPPRVVLDGHDVTAAIRTAEAGQDASRLSVHPQVRKGLVAQQRRMIESGGVVLEGRDTTTVVAPDADLKVFLTASIEERARRRWLEAGAKGQDVSLQAVVVDVVERDHRDYSRPDSPLSLAEDAVIIESFGLSPNDIVERIVRLLAERGYETDKPAI